jgi:peptide/nickel transport system substrate-binding protein
MIESMKDHKFDASVSGLTSDLISDNYQTWHSSSIANRGSNYGSFRNADSDKLLEQARLEFDREKRKDIYFKWLELIHEEEPSTFLYYGEETAAYTKRFQNVQWVPLRPGYDVMGWWTPRASQKYTNSTP